MTINTLGNRQADEYAIDEYKKGTKLKEIADHLNRSNLLNGEIVCTSRISKFATLSGCEPRIKRISKSKVKVQTEMFQPLPNPTKLDTLTELVNSNLSAELKKNRIERIGKKSMTRDQLFEFHTKTCAKALKLMKKKNADYSKGENPFGNFMVAEAMQASSAENGIIVRMGDKLSRLVSVLEKGAQNRRICGGYLRRYN